MSLPEFHEILSSLPGWALPHSSRRVKHPWHKMKCHHLMIPLIFSNLDWWALDFRCFYLNSISHLVQVMSNLRFWQKYCQHLQVKLVFVDLITMHNWGWSIILGVTHYQYTTSDREHCFLTAILWHFNNTFPLFHFPTEHMHTKIYQNAYLSTCCGMPCYYPWEAQPSGLFKKI